MADNNPTDYVWHPTTNRSFSARCHIETGNTWLRFGFDSDIGRVERPQDIHGNPIFIVVDSGKMLSVRGAVTVGTQDTEQMGTVTFTPQEEGITEWHWTLTRDGQTYAEEGRGMFRQDEPKPAAPRSRATKRAAGKKKPTSRKKLSTAKVARKKRPAAKKKSASKKKPASKKKQPRRSRRARR